jgi:hypothetical protein
MVSTGRHEPWRDGGALIVLEPGTGQNLQAALAELVTITQSLPPRLLIVAAGPEALDAVRAVPGVAVVATESVPRPVLDSLEPHERVFVEAWNVGRRRKPGRPGEGLPWDARGFEPPG